MAKSNFSIDEMVYNNVLQGKRIYYNQSLKVISYVKLEKKSRQVLIVCTDGDSFPVNQDDVLTWEVNTHLSMTKPNKSKIKNL